jgi:hypothetical protein
MADYNTNWIPIVEFETGRNVADKLDTSFDSIQTAFEDLNTNVKPSVVTNTNDISTLQSLVSINSGRITDLENALTVYEYSILPNPITITDDTAYTRVVSVVVDPLPKGVYEYKLSLRWSIDTTNVSAMFRYAIIRNDDANPVWYSFDQEVKDKTNGIVSSLFYPIDEQNEDKIEFALEAKVEAAGHNLTIEFADVIIDQKR